MLTPELSTSLVKIEERLGTLEAKSIQDNLMMASLKEEQDTEANRAMQDRLTIIGIRIPNINKMKDAEKNPAMKSKVEELVTKLKDHDKDCEVIFIRHLNRQAKRPENTVLEVRFKDERQAGMVRSNFIKNRESSDLENINITPTVRLATRVRVEILQSISDVIKRHDGSVVKIQCLQFVAKPILKVYRKGPRGEEYVKVMTFIDSVIWIKENALDDQLNLRKAYQRAGSAFRGTMGQHFVVMS